MKLAKYICIEGTEGVGKGLQTENLVKYLESKGYSVLLTKEPGTAHLPITQELRGIMLNQKYENTENVPLLLKDISDIIQKEKELTLTAIDFLVEALASVQAEQKMSIKAREYISQAIRSVHLEKLIEPSMLKYDFIIQDRGLLSGIAYGEACGNELSHLHKLAETVVGNCKIRSRNKIQKISIQLGMMKEFSDLYDSVIYLNGNSKKGLETAKNSKQEFKDGDAMELKGNSFMEQVAQNFKKSSSSFNSVKIIEVHQTTMEEELSDSDMKLVPTITFRPKEVIFKEILKAIGVQ